MKEISVKIYNFFGRPPLSYRTMTINAVTSYSIIILAIFSLNAESPTNIVCALFAVTLGIKLFISDSGVVLANLWNQAVGKLIYGTTAIILVQVSQMLADFWIQTIVQTNPGQLANGQRFLTISFIILGVVLIIYILMLIFLVAGFIAVILGFIYRVAVERNIKRFYSFAQLFSIAAFAVLIFKSPHINPFHPPAWIEVGFVTVAFTPNSRGSGWERLPDNMEREWVSFACNNLQRNSWVAFASDKVIPDEDVIEARPWKDVPEWARWKKATPRDDVPWTFGRYEFRRTKCENSNGSSDLHVVYGAPRRSQLPLNISP